MSARSLNKVLIIGNLTRDPELRYTPKGTAVCTFGVATNRSWVPNDGGERQEETEFHRIVAWSKLAEICSQLLYKGRRIYVEGRLQTRTWQGQDGQDRTTTEVVIDNMIALGAPKAAQEGGGTYQERPQAVADAPIQVDKVEDVLPEGDGAPAEKVEGEDKAGESDKKEKKPKRGRPKKKEEKDEGDVADDIPF